MGKKKGVPGGDWVKKAGKRAVVVPLDPEVKRAVERAAGLYQKPMRAIRTWLAAVIERAALEQLGSLEEGGEGWTEEQRRRWFDEVMAMRKWPGEN